MKQAFAAVAKATGLTFRYAGTTTVIPKAKKGYPGTFPTGTDIVIAWATPGVQSTMLPKSNGAAAMGGYDAVNAYTASGADAWNIYAGSVVVSAPMSPRHGPRVHLRAVRWTRPVAHARDRARRRPRRIRR